MPHSNTEAGVPQAARTPEPHETILRKIYELDEVVDRLDRLLAKITGTDSPPENIADRSPRSLRTFLVEGDGLLCDMAGNMHQRLADIERALFEE